MIDADAKENAQTFLSDKGFSLIELLVALAIFSIAALSLLDSQSSSVRAAGAVRAQTLASFVADNRVALFLGNITVPRPGQYSGEQQQMGVTYRWRENYQLIPGAQLMRMTVFVRDGEDNERAVLTALRRTD